MTNRMRRSLLALCLAGTAGFGLWLAQGAERPGALDAGEEAHALAFLKEYSPGEVEKLQRIKAEEPRAYTEHLREVLFRIEELERIRRNEPQEYAIIEKDMKERAAVHRLALEMKNAPPDQQAALEKQLRERLGQIYDRRTAMMRAELKEIEERLIEFREEVRIHGISRYAVTQERLAELTAGAEPVRW